MPPAPPRLHTGSAPPPPLQRWWTLGLPIGLSLVVHALLALSLTAVAWTLSGPAPQPPPGTEAFIATSPAPPPPRDDRPAPPPAQPHSPPTPQDSPAAAVVAPGPATPAPASPAPSTTATTGSAPRSGPASSAIEAALASPQAKAPNVQFGGLSAPRAQSVVFVVDGSAPMLGALPLLKASLERSARALLPIQQFSVVVFRDAASETDPSPPAAVFSDKLLDASPRNLARLADWLAPLAAKGRSNPLDGLRAALALQPRPHVVFLLSRSIPRSHGGNWEGGTDAILRELDALNPIDPALGRRRTVIKTLQFLEPDPTGTMQAIAAAHGSAASNAPSAASSPDHRVLKLEELPR